MKRTLCLAAIGGGALAVLAFPAAAQQLKTAEEAQSSSLTYAITAPLRDVNLIRSTVPVALSEALADPYHRPAVASCEGIIEEVTALNAALGDDMDADNVKKVGLRDRAKEEALNAIAGAASDLIPFRGWVRKLTGAERHDKRVQNAISAGFVRRAYLKGLGEARGCNPPATPMHKPLTDTMVASADAPPAVIATAVVSADPSTGPVPVAAVATETPLLTKTDLPRTDAAYAPD
ncbi:MAG TPA: hypothetical protein VIO94_17900 [Phenylobacterium sp.]